MSVFIDSGTDIGQIASGEPESLLATIGIKNSLTALESENYRQLLLGLHGCAEHIVNLPDYHPLDHLEYPRGKVTRPTITENALGNAWAHKFTIVGKSDGGILQAKSVCFKDCIAVAGVPQFFGTDAIPPWIPLRDATVVTRMLDAGATVVGTATCENFCNSTSSFTSAQGIVENPHAEGYSSGGSTSGGAALVGAGLVDIAIGADQGGSIRVPASFCGCVGIKPTHGMIPYTGITSGDAMNDHAGPIVKTVMEAAVCLDALCGRDRHDDRTLAAPLLGSTRFADSLRHATQGAVGMRIGLLVEGFEHHIIDQSVRSLVMHAAQMFTSLGAVVETVSLPDHLEGPALWTVQQRIAGSLNLLGLQHGRRGLQSVEFEETRLPWTKSTFERLFPSTKNTMINGLYLIKHFPGLYHKTMNIAQRVKDAYETLFEKYDIVLMPTTPCVAPKHANWHIGDPPLEAFKPSVGLTINTAIFNLTGHPAMSIPVGFCAATDNPSVQLPVGMQLVAGLWQEQKLLNAGHAWQSAFDWKTFSCDTPPPGVSRLRSNTRL